MSPSIRSVTRVMWTGLRAILVLTVILGVIYPLVVTGLAQLIFPSQANGSMIKDSSGQVVGSALIGQSFSDAAGNPLPQYFQPRPSESGYDAMASGGSNLGPESGKLLETIEARQAEIASFNGVAIDDVPVDAVTASASGLDPDISPAYAAIQESRVAQARNLPLAVVKQLVADHTSIPDLGYIGNSRVNILELNLALDNYHG